MKIMKSIFLIVLAKKKKIFLIVDLQNSIINL